MRTGPVAQPVVNIHRGGAPKAAYTAAGSPGQRYGTAGPASHPIGPTHACDGASNQQALPAGPTWATQPPHAQSVAIYDDPASAAGQPGWALSHQGQPGLLQPQPAAAPAQGRPAGGPGMPLPAAPPSRDPRLAAQLSTVAALLPVPFIPAAGPAGSAPQVRGPMATDPGALAAGGHAAALAMLSTALASSAAPPAPSAAANLPTAKRGRGRPRKHALSPHQKPGPAGTGRDQPHQASPSVSKRKPGRPRKIKIQLESAPQVSRPMSPSMQASHDISSKRHWAAALSVAGSWLSEHGSVSRLFSI